jgi:hypothetical protein
VRLLCVGGLDECGAANLRNQQESDERSALFAHV